MKKGLNAIFASALIISGCDLSTYSENKMEATIKITPYGVSHIVAKNYHGIGFGSGYAQARDHLCGLSDMFIRVNSKRSEYFGPDAFEAGDSNNLKSDFGYLGLQVRQHAVDNFSELSSNAKLLLSGYVNGYNKYLTEVSAKDEEANKHVCVQENWAMTIEPNDLLTYLVTFSLLGSSENFVDLLNYANPGDGQEWLPRIQPISPSANIAKGLRNGRSIYSSEKVKIQKPNVFPDLKKLRVGSNAWAIGGENSENKRGMILANPHFPHTGNLRFWESHLKIPGKLNVSGASLLGFPGVINIGHNENIAWTHTFSSAEHAIFYRLSLLPEDRTKYIYDGETKDIVKKTFMINVKAGDGLIKMEKDFYFSEFGPMLEFDGVMPWNDGIAFTIKDSNQANLDVIDHWLAINRARNIEEFQDTFRQYKGVSFNNTLYADKEGNAFYIDGSTVPELEPAAIALLKTNPDIQALRRNLGITILPGDSSLFDFKSTVSYKDAPKLLNQTYAQNSNDSHWATNISSPLVNYSPLYGPEMEELSLRTRKSLKLVTESRDEDGRLSQSKMEDALFSNSVYLKDLIIDDLIAQCLSQGTSPILLTESLAVNVEPACRTLQAWNGKQDRNSVGGHLIREFAVQFRTFLHLKNGFDPADPVNTPNQLVDNQQPMQMLALSMLNIENAGFPIDAELGHVQFVEPTTATGMPSGLIFPWAGAHDAEGGFNVFSTFTGMDKTLNPPHRYQPVIDIATGMPLVSGLSTKGYQISFGSSWMMTVEFTDSGPQAKGLLLYSQSSNNESPYYLDQTTRYSDGNKLRPMLFRDSEINSQTLEILKIKYRDS